VPQTFLSKKYSPNYNIGPRSFLFFFQIVSKFDLSEAEANSLAPVGLQGHFRELVAAMIESNCSLTAVVPVSLSRFEQTF
jgi:hypothetical protein